VVALEVASTSNVERMNKASFIEEEVKIAGHC
jgi:hypothetical protein